MNFANRDHQAKKLTNFRMVIKRGPTCKTGSLNPESIFGFSVDKSTTSSSLFKCFSKNSITCLLTLSLPDHISNSPNYLPYNSNNVSTENLVLDQLSIPKFIFLFILITCLVDTVLIL